MKNYIIFGGTGFIGTHLARAIKEKDPQAKIWNLDLIEPGTPFPWVKNYKPALLPGEQHPAEFLHCDVRKPIEVPFEPTPDDIIFNFAAVHRTPGHPDREYFETNIRGAENVTAFAERHGISNIVFTSSIAPYGASEELKEEDTLPMPNTPYGISKLVAEKIHLAWAAADKDRRLLIVRPGVVFGRGENGNFSRLFAGISRGRFAYPGRRDTIKACIYVKDLAGFMLWSVLEGKDNGQPQIQLCNCTYEPAYTIEQICDHMKKVTGIKRNIPEIPNWLIMPAATIIGALGAPMGICPARVKKLQVSTNICGKRLAASRYKMKYAFDEALADWWRDGNSSTLE